MGDVELSDVPDVDEIDVHVLLHAMCALMRLCAYMMMMLCAQCMCGVGLYMMMEKWVDG